MTTETGERDVPGLQSEIVELGFVAERDEDREKEFTPEIVAGLVVDQTNLAMFYRTGQADPVSAWELLSEALEARGSSWDEPRAPVRYRRDGSFLAMAQVFAEFDAGTVFVPTVEGRVPLRRIDARVRHTGIARR